MKEVAGRSKYFILYVNAGQNSGRDWAARAVKRIDNEAGMVKLALGRLGQTTVPSPPGVLATVDFKITDSTTSGTYELKLNKVGLADENFQDIAGFTVQGARIKISS